MATVARDWQSWAVRRQVEADVRHMLEKLVNTRSPDVHCLEDAHALAGLVDLLLVAWPEWPGWPDTPTPEDPGTDRW
jgi:hypothetical protein